MRTIFYLRSAYLAAQLTAPLCFIELDTFYEPILPDISTGWRSFHLRHAENICRRMSDIDLYAWFISDHPLPLHLVEDFVEKPLVDHEALVRAGQPLEPQEIGR
jgi:hypothetical protein